LLFAQLERQKKWAATNLYIKNLPDDFDDDRLRVEFSKFGVITSSRIMVRPVGCASVVAFLHEDDETYQLSTFVLLNVHERQLHL